MKTIGIVAEGPRDFELIAAVIDTITNEENNYQFYRFLSLVLHPNGDAEQEKHTYLTR